MSTIITPITTTCTSSIEFSTTVRYNRFSYQCLETTRRTTTTTTTKPIPTKPTTTTTTTSYSGFKIQKKSQSLSIQKLGRNCDFTFPTASIKISRCQR